MIVAFVTSILLIIIDQFLKYQAVIYLKGNDSVTLIPHVLGLTYLENRGAAWGIFAGNKFFLIGLTGIFLIVILWALFTKKIQDPILQWVACLFFAGGVGNLIDRIFSGYVVDYVQFLFISFPIFNFADMCIVAGFILFIFDLIWTEWQKKKQGKIEINGH